MIDNKWPKFGPQYKGSHFEFCNFDFRFGFSEFRIFKNSNFSCFEFRKIRISQVLNFEKFEFQNLEISKSSNIGTFEFTNSEI